MLPAQRLPVRKSLTSFICEGFGFVRTSEFDSSCLSRRTRPHMLDDSFKSHDDRVNRFAFTFKLQPCFVKFLVILIESHSV
jgi:hypothetical protein